MCSIRSILESIQKMLKCPCSDEPLDENVGRQLANMPEVFARTAKYWCNAYAEGPYTEPECDRKVEKLLEMGINKVNDHP